MSEIQTSLNELNTLLPEPEPLTIAGETLTIEPLRVKALGRAMAAAYPMWEQLKALELSPAKAPGLDAMELAPVVLKLLATHAESLHVLIGILAGKPKAWVEELQLHDLVRLVATVVRVNLDFFVRVLWPVVVREFAALTGRFSSLAPPSSSTSAPTPSPGPASSSG